MALILTCVEKYRKGGGTNIVETVPLISGEQWLQINNLFLFQIIMK
jgi:hypothetical protein